MAIDTYVLDDAKLDVLRTKSETHFFDFKSNKVTPAKLTKTISAFANADGGEIYVGIEDPKRKWEWDGFANVESANGHLQIFEKLYPLGHGFRYEFLSAEGEKGLVLRIEVDKSPDIKKASDGEVYLRRGAQSLPVKEVQALKRLELAKGIVSYEDQTVPVNLAEIENSVKTIEFMLSLIPDAEPSSWLRKQRLIVGEKATVAGALLFAEEPQIILPKAAIKIYRYKTAEREGSRDTLAEDPVSVEGSIYDQIYQAVDIVKTQTESIPIVGQSGVQKIEYPTVAIHEIITNAVLHRDYSLSDDAHVRIFDDRIEVESPGRLPAHITEKNILDERFARNPKIVRLINKFNNPPNKDVGEGLNTSFQAMRELKLRDPIIVQRDNSVLVILKHEKLGSSEEIVMNYLRENDEINNTKARELCHIGDANKMKRVFQKLMKAEVIERIPGRAQNKAAYSKGKNFPP